MTLPTLWIRQNMLQSPVPASNNNNNERPLTEAEIKVQRSLKKLSIPEWYLNNSSHPPKILMNDTPIDMRPPSWKDLENPKKSVVCSTPIMPARNSTVNRNGVLETEIGAPTLQNKSYGTFKINRSSPSNRSPMSKKRSSAYPKSQARETPRSLKSRLMNISRTFPRVSPSRKIQNINLVFDNPPKSSHSQSHTITDLDVSIPEMGIIEDSLQENIVVPTPATPETLSQSLMITDLDQSEIELAAIDDSIDISSEEPIAQRVESPQMPSESCPITDLDESESETCEIIDSSLYQNPGAEFTNETFEISNIDDTSFKVDTCERRAPKMPNSQLTYIKPWKTPTRPEVQSCVTPEGKFTSAASFKLRASSTPQGSPASLFSATAIELTPRNNGGQQPISGLPVVRSRESRKTPSPTARAPETTVSAEEEICDACKADPSRARSSPLPNSRPSSGFRPRSLLQPIGEKPANGARPSATPSPSIAFLNSKKKSSELENIIKRKQSPRQGKSLVQEIIEELNEKCRSSAQPTYVSPGSKNFVKKLVRALEKGTSPCRQAEEEAESSYQHYADYENYEDCKYAEEEEEEDRFVESENGSEDDAKSAAASTSISYKDTDSSSAGSDSDMHSPTEKLSYNYDWNMNVEKDRNAPETAAPSATNMTTSTPEATEEKDDSVYWIPIAKTKLPRTSSLLNMMSRLSSNNPGQQSPCISPIKRTDDHRSNGWGSTYRATNNRRALRRIDETTILDSGYSDRSRVHSSESSDDTWFDDSESTWTASEGGSCSNFSFSLGSRLRLERRSAAQIHGRPFII